MRTTIPLRTIAALFAALGIIPLANIIAGGTETPWWGFAVREWLTRGAIVIAIAVLVAAVLGPRVDAILERAKRELQQPPPLAFAICISLLAFGAAAFYARFCFAGQPFTSDEMSQLWHAHILLSGHLSAQAEPLREFFNTAPEFDRDGRWFSQYPIGGPAFLAAGMPFKAAWLVNPLLLAVTTYSLYRFLAVAFDDFTARVTTLLFVVSPMVLIMAASQMNHVPTLAFTMIALAALARWDRSDHQRTRQGQAALVGLAVGIIALIRPLDAFLVAVIIGCYQIWRARQAAARWRSLVPQFVVGAIPVALLLWANWRTTGRPLLFAYEALNGPEHSMGFHIDPAGAMHTPTHGVVLASGYLMRLSRYLFEWPLPGMLIIVTGLLAIRRPSRWDVLLAALAAALPIAYGAYWFNGFFAGPRFLFTAAPAYVYFAARAPGSVAALASQPWLKRAVLLIVPLCVLMAWVGPDGVSSAKGRTVQYREQRTKLKTDVEAQVGRDGIHNALVFVNEGWRGRIEARLRVLGLSQFRADRTLSTVDACALQTALDAEDSLSARNGQERAERVLQRAHAFGKATAQSGAQADQTIALVPGSLPTKVCVREFERDLPGTISYPLFLARQHVQPDGRIGGDIVFARDLGDRNELLRGRFGDRTWYVYRVARALDDTERVFIPYASRFAP